MTVRHVFMSHGVSLLAADNDHWPATRAFHLHGLWALSDRVLRGALPASRAEQLLLLVVKGSLAPFR